MNRASSPKSGPLLNLLGSSLKLWVRRQCNGIGQLKIELNGTLLELLKGNLNGLNLYAREINFKGLKMQYANLKTGAINFGIKNEAKNKQFTIKNQFEIRGEISFEGKELNSVLLAESWNWLGNWLTKTLLGVPKLTNLQIVDNVLELRSYIQSEDIHIVKRFILKVNDGSILICEENKTNEAMLPMDPSIKISEAILKEGNLLLKGKSIVTP